MYSGVLRLGKIGDYFVTRHTRAITSICGRKPRTSLAAMFIHGPSNRSDFYSPGMTPMHIQHDRKTIIKLLPGNPSFSL